MNAWCPECGPVESHDEDGCCTTCGSTATGPGADHAHAQAARIAELEAQVTRLQLTGTELVEQRREAEAQVERLRKAIAPTWPTDKPNEQYEELMARYRASATKVYAI